MFFPRIFYALLLLWRKMSSYEKSLYVYVNVINVFVIDCKSLEGDVALYIVYLNDWIMLSESFTLQRRQLRLLHFLGCTSLDVFAAGRTDFKLNLKTKFHIFWYFLPIIFSQNLNLNIWYLSFHQSFPKSVSCKFKSAFLNFLINRVFQK